MHTAEQIEQIRISYVRENQRATAKRVDVVGGGVVFLFEVDTNIYGVGFKGRSVKPDFNFLFRSVQSRDEYVAEWSRSLDAIAMARKERSERRAEERKKETHNFLVGSVLYSMWGYDQTNVDWYQVIAVVSNKTVIIRKIGASVTNADGPMSGYSVPACNEFIGESMRKRANSRGVSLTSFSHAWPWDGKPKYCTWYA